MKGGLRENKQKTKGGIYSSQRLRFDRADKRIWGREGI